ncbi:hypothetical protein JAAARDRAFT_254655 [Jaapia argillacea MUCL 33604]|uniref:Protein kinase domain-containing protein n=1 Tax=Jaapia argillacea MUCL 33604 TaxID=933084 RepID=A0A067PT68_9AGAM|nr:hypothetical protein JAAARDRAFT_254655 [Jaapia argillacea MUCL 33604]
MTQLVALYPHRGESEEAPNQPFNSAGGNSIYEVDGSHYVNIFSVKRFDTTQLGKAIRSSSKDVSAGSRHLAILSHLVTVNQFPGCTGWTIDTATQDFPMAIMPYFSNGNLAKYVDGKPESEKLYFLASAASVLRGLHDSGIAHGHIAPQNFLVKDDGDVVVSDVLLEITMREEYWRTHGTIPPPSLWQYRPMEELLPPESSSAVVPHSMAGDVFAFGAVTYEILAKKLPSSWHDFTRCSATGRHRLSTIQRPYSIKNDAIWELLRECWRDDPGSRPSMAKVENLLRGFACSF